MKTYDQFLNDKIEVAKESGFEISLDEINPALKPHQKLAVQWAVKGGRRGLFERFGLGKTVQELEFCRIVTEHEGGQALIVLPLGVRQEFTRDARELLHIPEPVYVTCMDEVRASDAQILMTNYERVRDGDIDPKYFTAVSLDEAAVLRSYGSKTYQTFFPKFKGIKYKLVATATPSPNRYKELIHYAGFLDLMDTGQALTRFFKRDSTKANNLQLYPSMEREFWLWVASWGLFLSSPADLGLDATGYDLPPFEVRTHIIDDDMENLPADRDGQFKLLRDTATSLSEAAREKSSSIAARVAKAKELIDEASPDEHFILWHDLEAERHAIKKAIPEAVDIYGSMDYDERERRVIDFQEGKTRIFATKKSLSGCGCNFQKYCHRAIFVGIDYEFNDFIQAIHRIHRFLQTEKVIIDIIYTQAEEEIWEALREKWKRHDELAQKMSEIIKKYGLSSPHIAEQLKRSKGVKRVEIKRERFTAVNNDCVDETRKMPSDSVGLIHTSIPFSNHYEYTPSYNDFGHNATTAQFFKQMDYLTPELLRVLQPGRVCATDGFILAESSIPCEEGTAPSATATIPPKALLELSDATDAVEVSVSSKHFIAQTRDYTLFSRLMSTAWEIDVDKIIPKNTASVKTDFKALTSALERVQILASTETQPVKMSLSRDAIELSVRTTIGSATDSVMGETDSDLVIGINARYLVGVLKAAETDSFLVSSPVSPLVFKDDSSTYILLPVRLRERI